ncbi:MAG: transglycosylase SLT domain-containing protein [Deltaproteobacteria bacterium]|nr:transglycosylase SLT domain-containing protein [Deltaproteobacteria bacterium]MBI3293773.1 transglycosylase SLT domain-containing protein [Deltaproteobacteria bacterium]
MAPWLTYIPIVLAALVLVPQSSPRVVDKGLLVSGFHETRGAPPKTSARREAGWEVFKPAWKSSSNRSFFSAAFDANPFAVAGLDADDLVLDPSNALETEFKIPGYLKSRVAFWIRVYSQYNSQVRIVHDRNRIDLVYGIIDLRPLHRELGNTVVFDIRANALERTVLRQLKTLILNASSGRPLSSTDPDMAELRTLLSRFGALNPLEGQRLVRDLRTQTGQRDMFLQALHRSKELLPHIESVLRQNGLPITLGRIPFVESSFNVRAQSKIGAVGIWQFTPETAREWIAKDEERFWSDPIRQTRSAARLLRGYRAMLPDWSTAVTSYNSGIGRIRRLTQKHRSNSIEPLIAARENGGLGFAGKNFFAEVMAATLVEAYKEQLFGAHMLPDKDSEMALQAVPTPDRCER